MSIPNKSQNCVTTINLVVWLLFALVFLTTTSTHAQIQKGQDIDGESAEDYSGYSVSMPDVKTVAIGAHYNDDNGINAGHVRIYRWNGTSWQQKGADIDGHMAGDFFGWDVSMPDSNTVAISAVNASRKGYVSIFIWNGVVWQQKGQKIEGEAVGDQFGWSVSMPDSNTVAIGGNLNDDNGPASGHLRIYRWNSIAGIWQQKGGDIDGKANGSNLGISTVMPDSNTVAGGSPGDNFNTGLVQVYSWNGSLWQQKGLGIEGETIGDGFGKSASMSDSNTIAIGTPHNDGNGNNAGHVRIYRWNGTSWQQKGVDIDGEAFNDFSGVSVSMPDSNTVAIGASNNAGKAIYAGHVRIYRWNGNSWQQRGMDIDGEATYDYSGGAVSMPDSNTVAIGAKGAPFGFGNGNDAGQVRVYTFCIPDSVIDLQTACDTYTWIDGITYTSSTNSPTVTLTNSLGCDSVVTLDLTINNPTNGIVVITACDTYTWIDGITYTSSTNSPTVTLTNSLGCDSVVTLDLTINSSNTDTDVITACDTYTWIDGITYTSNTNSPTVTLANSSGCDSVVTLDLTINKIDNSVTVYEDSLVANQLAAQYQWLNCDNGHSLISAATNQSFFTYKHGNYACAISLNGCVDTTACHPLIVEICGVDFPNVFTPNGDQVNDYFIPIHECDFLVYQLTIYDRTGQNVFTSDAPNSNWDGRIRGRKARSGTYFYVFKYVASETSNKKVEKGNFTLMR